MSSQNKLQGTITAIITPFKKDNSIDEVALKKLVDFQIAGGVEGIIPLGTTGEYPTLSESEQRKVIEIVIEQTNKRATIIAGAGSNNTASVIEKVKFAKQAGADGVLVVGPYYNKPTQNGHYQHIKAIADAVDFPIMLYNVPGRTSSNIEASTILRIAEEIPTVTMLKEASGNINQVMEILRNKPKNFSVFSGDDALAYSIIGLGGVGCVSVVSNEIPKEFSTLVRKCLEGKWDEARLLQYKYLPLMNINFIESSPIPVKAALAMMGMIEEKYRLPLCPITEPNRVKLKQVLSDLGLV